MKKTLLTILGLSLHFLYSSDFVDITLNKYITFVAKTYNQTILIDKDINQNITLLIDEKIQKNTYLKILKQSLINNDLELIKKSDFYYIQKLEDKSLYKIKLDYINLTSLEPYLNLYKDVNYTYSDNTKYLYLKTTKQNYNSIKNHIKQIDTPPKQRKIKINIFEIDVSKVKDKQFSIISTLRDFEIFGIDTILNLLVTPFTAQSSTISNDSFNITLNYLNEKGYTKILSSPTLTLRDNKKTTFNIVNNIPYLETSTDTDSTISTNQNNYTYRDVGLQITINSKIFDNYVDLDLILNDEVLIDNLSSTPTTSKKYLNQSFILNNNQVFLLAGFNRQEHSKTKDTSLLSLFNNSSKDISKKLILTIQSLTEHSKDDIIVDYDDFNMSSQICKIGE